jgi:uncharacterized membrane protein YsdA (DUF1294 family)
MSIWTYLPAYLVIVNGWTVLRFWQDKQAAIGGDRRVPEADLLGLALIGGSPGAIYARTRLRHKTRKQPFSTQLNFIAAIQVGVVAGLGFAFW